MAYSKKTKEKIAALEKQIEELNINIAEENKTVKRLENEIQDITVKYKYTLFDIEATKREIEYYKKMLRERDE